MSNDSYGAIKNQMKPLSMVCLSLMFWQRKGARERILHKLSLLALKPSFLLINCILLRCLKFAQILQLCGDVQHYRRLQPLKREGCLSCHNCCETKPRFLRSHLKDCPIQTPCTISRGLLRTYSYTDPQETF